MSILYGVLRTAYLRAPIGQDQKLRIKAFLFEQFPGLFRGWPPFEAWRRQVEGLAGLPSDYEPASPPKRPDPAAWKHFLRDGVRRDASSCSSTAPYVVVPVYSGTDETLACLYSVVSSTPRLRFELVVIFDAGPETELRDTLRALANDGHFTLIENQENLGFVATANRGLGYDATRDVVLLNADTEVYGDWLDRLASPVQHDIGTVTPLTNNGEIASYPFWLANNAQALELGYADLDRLAARVNAGCVVDVPTGVGFCMLIRRDLLDQVGSLDVATFQRGYGEENDLSLRAAEAGWRNVVTTDVFVRHFGGVSFGASKARALRRGVESVERLHPGYRSRIQAFIAEDDLRPARSALDAARLRRAVAGDARDGVSLFTVHGTGGGTWSHAQHLARRLLDEGRRVAVLLPDAHEPRRVSLFMAGMGPGTRDVRLNPMDLPATPNLQWFDLDRDTPALVAACRELGVDHVHVHHVMGFGPGAPVWLTGLAEQTGASLDVTLHDYAAICPRVHVNDEHGRYCGLPDQPSCETCIRRRGTRVDTPSVWLWRRQFGELLRTARRVIAPSAGLAETIGRYFPEVDVAVKPHFEDLRELELHETPEVGDRLRVVVLGAIGEHKGYHLLAELATDARRRGLLIDFNVVGYTADDAWLRRHGVRVTGAYAYADLNAHIARIRPHMALFLSLWPETYSYTLSEAVALGLFPVSVDLGAPAERIRDLGWGELIPFSATRDASDFNDRLVRTRPAAPPAAVRNRSWIASYRSIWRDYYGFTRPARGSADADPAVVSAGSL